MTIIQYNRRNFLSSIAILSVGTAFGSTIKHFPSLNGKEDLQKKWIAFWKKSGGRIFYSLTDLNASSHQTETKGHHYTYGEVIYFPQENILAQPTWIFWNDRTKPADVIITLFENNHSFKKILRFNRYEMDALYRISKEPGTEQLLLASFHNAIPIGCTPGGIITSKTNIKKNSQIQDISYYKGQLLVFKDKIIHHT
jgi:hypothetical protein